MMKRLLRGIARRCWRLAGPIRRPLDRKIGAKLTTVVAATVREETHAQLDLLLRVMNAARHEANVHRSETNLALDALVREVSRLQFRVEELERSLLDATERSGGLGLIDEAA